ncbi:MAG: ferrous iron transport protein A [Thermoplasmata archaeon]|nr:MAG: ferrous iron transport protein A [Thermoplasmata archaeon]
MEIPLIQLGPGKKATITRVEGGEGGRGFQINLGTRGIRKGKEVEVVTMHPMQGPVVIRIDGRETTIGRKMAARIFVDAGNI